MIGSVFSRELTVETSTRTKSNVNAAFCVIDKLSPVVTAHQNNDSILVTKDHVSRSKMNHQPQVDVGDAVKALYAAGAVIVSIGKEGVTGTVEVLNSFSGSQFGIPTISGGPNDNPDGDAPQADVMAWINALLASGHDRVTLDCDGPYGPYDRFWTFGYFYVH